MENTSQTLAAESFSYRWLATETSSSKTNQNPTQYDEQQPCTQQAVAFNFDISRATMANLSLVHADKLFSNGVIRPQSLDENASKTDTNNDSTTATTTPTSTPLQTPHFTQAEEFQGIFLRKWKSFPRRMVSKYLKCFVFGKGTRGRIRVDDLNRKCLEVKSSSSSNENSSPRVRVGRQSSSGWSDESSIHEAILYCKQSNNGSRENEIASPGGSDCKFYFSGQINQIQYRNILHPQQQWVPPNPPQSSSFWTHFNVVHHLHDLHHTLLLANSMQIELEMLMKVKEAKACEGNVDDFDGSSMKRSDFDGFVKYIEENRIDLGAQELISIEAVNGLMSKLRFLIEPFRVVTDEGSPWEEKSAAVRLNDKINKSKRNKRWRNKKRQRVAELHSKKGELFEKLDREADEWRAKEIAKDMAQQKVEKMKEIAKRKAKEERKKLEAELELALMVEKLQELRSIRIQKMKKQGHFLPEEDDKFLERVQAAVEEEERQAKAAADTDAARDAIAAAEEFRKQSQGVNLDLKEGSKEDVSEEIPEKKTQSESALGSHVATDKRPEKQGSEGQNYGAYDYVANLPPEFYHYYHGSNTDMGTLIEVRRTWDAYIRPGGSRIPGHWVQPPPRQMRYGHHI